MPDEKATLKDDFVFKPDQNFVLQNQTLLDVDLDDEASAVRIKFPPFWPEKPEIWFYQIEAQFRGKVRTEAAKFNQLVANLEVKYLENIWDIVSNEEIANKYTAAKDRLLNIFKESDDKQLRKLLTGIELGDLKPSQLLRKMQSLAGADVSDKALKTLWLDKLPDSIKNILLVSNESLENVAIMADKIIEMNPRTDVYKVSKVSNNDNAVLPNELFASLVSQIAALERKVDALQFRSRSRSPDQSRSHSRDSRANRSRSRGRYNPQGKYCFYHFRFGDRCFTNKCKPPCAWKKAENENQQAK